LEEEYILETNQEDDHTVLAKGSLENCRLAAQFYPRDFLRILKVVEEFAPETGVNVREGLLESHNITQPK
jgi:hypothetical protein